MDNENLANLLFPNINKKPEDYLIQYPARKTPAYRLAPSPTGYLHLGNFYSAFIQFCEAKRDGGVFYIRLEDTDQKREIKNAGEIAYNGLLSYGVNPHEGYRGDSLPEVGKYGPYVQSKRIEIYQAFAKDLVRRGNAFPCFCEVTQSKQEILDKREKQLEENESITEKDGCRDLEFNEIKKKIASKKEFAIRLRSKGDGTTSRKVADLFKGEREIKENAKDIIILKRNGIPPYALAHMVDDVLMRTSTVIRGEDWYSSLPAHIELFEAAGFAPIQYGHNPLICTVDVTTGNKRKLSKRHDPHADMRYYNQVGYPTEAVHEYLLTLANSDFEPWRIANPNKSYWEFPFSLSKVGSNNPIFDLQKLDYISKNIIAKKTCEQVNAEVFDFFKGKDSNYLERIYGILAIDRGTEKPRKDIAKYSDIPMLYDYILTAPKPAANEITRAYAKIYNHADTKDEWFARVKAAADNVREYTKAVRVAITGKENTPDLYAIMQILGEQEVIKRLTAQ